MKKIFKIISCGLIALTLTGCGSDQTPANGDESIITFNKEEMNITVDELYKELKSRYAANYLINYMDEKILNIEYETNSDTDKYVENRIKITKMYYENDDSKFQEALQNAGYRSISEYEDYLRTAYKRTLATKDYVKDQISDSDIQKYYDDNVYGDVTVSHILVKVDSNDGMSDEEKKKAESDAQDTIKKIYEKLNEGTAFAEVAKEYSQDSATSKNGGLVGTFNKGEMTKKFNEEFENAVLNLEVGKYTSKTVQSSYGYHIIYKDAQKEKPALETVKETILNNLIEEKENDDTKSEYKALIALREKYGLTINDDELKTQYDTAVNNWLYSNDN